MTTAQPAPERTRTIDDVPGWFPGPDQRLFAWLLDRQDRLDQRGDLLELGSYLGKSAALIGRYVRDGETFTVCDLFESAAPDEADEEEVRSSYEGLTRAAFEENYLAVHGRLPEIVQGPTARIPDRVRPGSCRFAHIDASRRYARVREDVATARRALGPDGIVAVAGHRSERAPGVAAAVWEAAARDGLRPICVTSEKLYGTWEAPGPIQHELLLWLSGHGAGRHEVQEVHGRPLIRIADIGPRRPSALEEEVRRLRGEVELEREKTRRARAALRKKQRELDAVRGSVSFRTGRVFTAPPRALRTVTQRTGR